MLRNSRGSRAAVLTHVAGLRNPLGFLGKLGRHYELFKGLYVPDVAMICRSEEWCDTRGCADTVE